MAIARAVLRQARLVICDEATAALDPATEQAVWSGLSGLAEPATTLVATHRLSALTKADLILVLERGRIVAQGRHEALLAQRGLYAAFWRAGRKSTV